MSDILDVMSGSREIFESLSATRFETKRFGQVFDEIGYWGPVTSSIDWCERNHQLSFYIAEFFNSTSNVVTVLAGFLLYIQAHMMKLEARYKLAALFLVLVGLGSFAFHATLQFEAQLFDELPMLFMQLVYSYIVMETFTTRFAKALPWVTWTFGLVYSVLHVYYRLVIVFHIVFGASLLPGVLFPIRFASRDPIVKMLYTKAMVSFSMSFALWKIDQVFCPDIEKLYLHAFWHVGSAWTAVLWTSCMMFIHLKYARLVPVQVTMKWRILPILTTSKGLGKKEN